MTHRSGRHFLQVPGPSNVPDRVLRAMAAPTIDHRGSEFRELAREVLAGLAGVVRTAQPVVLFPASGTGAWEAALANTLSPGDHVLMAETGHFAALWKRVALQLGLDPIFLPGDWRRGVDAAAVEARLADDPAGEIKAVCIVHNETSTGVTSNVPAVRRAIDAARHPALLMVDTISSLASIDYRHDEWGVDVTIGASQKGLMLPPGLSLNAVSERALAAHAGGPSAAQLLELDTDRRRQPQRCFSVHAAHQSPVRAARGAADAGGRGSGAGRRPPRTPRGGRTRRRANVGVSSWSAPTRPSTARRSRPS